MRGFESFLFLVLGTIQQISQTHLPRSISMLQTFKSHKTAVALAAMCLASLSMAQITTEFSASGTTGSFQINDGSLYDLTQLASPGAQTYNYNSQYFNPSTSGTYTFGTSKANFDTVIIVYGGSYDPTNPSQNALVLNDDSGGAQAGLGLTNAGTCGSPNWCSQVSQSLTAGTNYYIVTTTYNAGTSITGDVWYYVIGPGGVGVGGNPYVPPPPALSVFTSSSNLTNSPAYGAARIIDATPDLLALFTGAGLTGDQAVSDAASQTLPLLVGSSQLAATSALASINRIILARLDGNRGLSAGDAFLGDRHFWIKPFGSWARQSDQGSIAGFKASTGGMAMGLDGALSDHTNVGLAFAWAKSSIDGRSAVAPSSAAVNLYQLIGYGSRALGNGSEINFQFDYGRNTNKGTRTIAFTNTVAQSSYNTTSFHAGVGWGTVRTLSEKTAYVPSIRLDYTRLRDEAYAETGAGLLNLNVNARTTTQLVLGGDVKFNHQLTSSTLLSVNAGIGYDFHAKGSSITASFAGAPSLGFVTNGIRPDPWTLKAGLGFVHTTSAGAEVTSRLDVEKRAGFHNATVAVKARWSF